MDLLWYGFFFTLGAIIGSFLNVVIYRLHTGRSLQGRSHCMSCGKRLTWKELFPLVSYLLQGGACRGCGAYIPSRYFWVELVTGCLFALALHLFFGAPFLLLLTLLLMAVLVVIVVYDMRHTIIPDELTVLTLILSALYLVYGYTEHQTFMILLTEIGGGLIAGLFFFALWYVSRGRWIGLGDAKLALPLGIIVGYADVFSMIVLSFWIGALVSLILLGLQSMLKQGKRRLRFLATPLTIKSEVPFAPFLVLGFLFVYLFHANIFTITYWIFF